MILLVYVGAEFAQAQLEQLVSKVPPTANAIVVVNSKAVLSSPMAASGEWRQQRLQAGRQGMIAAPPSAHGSRDRL